jgi:Xaa-Pro aminopeptidase
MKVKNAAELAGMRQAHIVDGVASGKLRFVARNIRL